MGWRSGSSTATTAPAKDVEYTDAPAFSVQFHPEACGGPRDTGYLFDRFAACIKESQQEGSPCL